MDNVTNPAPKKDPIEINLSKLIQLFDNAKLKKPVLLAQAQGMDLQLTVAGPSAKLPGSLNVMSPGSYSNREWYGRVTKDGHFEPHKNLDDASVEAIVAALRWLGNHPAKAASDYGSITGRCCFCDLPLTDPRSTEVGYGKICAQKWNLPYGLSAKHLLEVM